MAKGGGACDLAKTLAHLGNAGGRTGIEDARCGGCDGRDLSGDKIDNFGNHIAGRHMGSKFDGVGQKPRNRRAQCFGTEYGRMFGSPPARDIKAAKARMQPAA